MTIVDFLGHHPTTTEMNKKPEWRNIWFGISRCWEGIDKFRTEYGIEKPTIIVHSMWKKSIIKRQLKKQEKINKIINLLESQGEANQTMIIETFGYSPASVNNYIKELFDKHLIKKRRLGTRIFYDLNNSKYKKTIIS